MEAKFAHQDLQLLGLLHVALLGDALVQVLVRQPQDGQPVPPTTPPSLSV